MAVTSPREQSAVEAVLRRVLAPRARVYALLDAARCPDGPEQAKRAQLRHQSLLAGDLGQELREVAPYLVEFRAGSSFGELTQRAAGRSRTSG